MAAVVVVVPVMEVMAEEVEKKNIDFPCQKEAVFVKIKEALLMVL